MRSAQISLLFRPYTIRPRTYNTCVAEESSGTELAFPAVWSSLQLALWIDRGDREMLVVSVSPITYFFDKVSPTYHICVCALCGSGTCTHLYICFWAMQNESGIAWRGWIWCGFCPRAGSTQGAWSCTNRSQLCVHLLQLVRATNWRLNDPLSLTRTWRYTYIRTRYIEELKWRNKGATGQSQEAMLAWGWWFGRRNEVAGL